jgi:hypothetical protein
MPTKHTVLSYKFDELADKAKERALDWYREGALDYEWWDFTYADAADIGMKITGFDLAMAPYVDAKFKQSADKVAAAILATHGDESSTYIAASTHVRCWGDEPTDEQSDAFLKDLRACYWGILYNEAAYLTSDEACKEGIEANEYDFTKEGKRFAV